MGIIWDLQSFVYLLNVFLECMDGDGILDCGLPLIFISLALRHHGESHGRLVSSCSPTTAQANPDLEIYSFCVGEN